MNTHLLTNQKAKMKYQNLKIESHGEVSGERDGNQFGGNLSLIVIQEAWSHGCDFSHIVELADEDWSFIRDADDSDINLCLAEALNFINEKLK
jgi:hypothetical protein